MANVTTRRQRKLQRLFHLLAGATLLAYVYLPAAHQLHDPVRLVAVPVLTLTGIAMWQTARLRRAIRTARQVRWIGRLPADEREDQHGP
jgi:hypothetical protein